MSIKSQAGSVGMAENIDMNEKPIWKVEGESGGLGGVTDIFSRIDSKNGLVTYRYMGIKWECMADVYDRIDVIPSGQFHGAVDYAKVHQKIQGGKGVLRTEFMGSEVFWVRVMGYGLSCWDKMYGEYHSRDKFTFPGGDLGQISLGYDRQSAKLYDVNIRIPDICHFISTLKYTAVTDGACVRNMTQSRVDIGWQDFVARAGDQPFIFKDIPGAHASGGFGHCNEVMLSITSSGDTFRLEYFSKLGSKPAFSFDLPSNIGEVPVIDIANRTPAQAVMDKGNQLNRFARNIWRADSGFTGK